ncbi:MAG: hypothetical protein ACLFTK_08045, partial [Anaerolineales bacterium]
PHKILVVLVKTLAPVHFNIWSQRPPGGWETPFVLSAQHPQWSAEFCEALGTDPLSIELIRRHQERHTRPPQSEADRLLRILQAADDRN